MTAVSRNVYIDELADTFDKCQNTYHSTMKLKSGNVESKTYLDFNKEIGNKDSKFEVGDHVRTSKYKNIFVNGCTPNWSEEVFVNCKMLKIWCCGHKVLVTLTVKKLLESLTKKNCKK